MVEHEKSGHGARHGQTAAVVCVWCGSEIHRGCEPKTWGMCQACFRRMVSEHQRLAQRSQDRFRASER